MGQFLYKRSAKYIWFYDWIIINIWILMQHIIHALGFNKIHSSIFMMIGSIEKALNSQFSFKILCYHLRKRKSSDLTFSESCRFCKITWTKPVEILRRFYLSNRRSFYMNGASIRSADKEAFRSILHGNWNYSFYESREVRVKDSMMKMTSLSGLHDSFSRKELIWCEKFFS